MIKVCGAFLVSVFLGAGALEAADFLRGDFNSDGKVSVADGYWISSFLFRGAGPAPCINAGVPTTAAASRSRTRSLCSPTWSSTARRRPAPTHSLAPIRR
jgi:hypothetical protein